jgi:hypothetical protein
MGSNPVKKPFVEELLQKWYMRAYQSQFTHYRCVNFFSALNLLLGIPAIVLAMTVGTAVFVSLERETSGYVKIVFGLISIMAGVLSILQTFLRYSERSEKHRTTSARYGAIRRRLEYIWTLAPDDKEEISNILAGINKELDHLAESSPEVPAFIFKRVKKEVTERPPKLGEVHSLIPSS